MKGSVNKTLEIFYVNQNLLVYNIPFSEWATLFSDDKVASAILDRLLHHAHVVPIIGNSYRLKNHVSFE